MCDAQPTQQFPTMPSAGNTTTRLQRVLLALFYYYATFVGMSSYSHDFKAQTFAKTRLSNCLALFANILTVLLLPLFVWNTLRPLGDTDTPIMTAAYRVDFVVRALAILYTVLYRYKRERATWRVVNAMIQLDLGYMAHLPHNAAIERRIERLFFLKYALTVYLGLSVLLNLFTAETKPWRWYSYLQVLLQVQALCIVHVTTLGYFLALLYVYRSLCYLNVQLRQLLQLMQLQLPLPVTLERRYLEKLRQFETVHWLVAQAALQYSQIYRFQMLAVRCSCVLSNVAMGYYGFVFMFYKRLSTGWLLYGAFSYVVMMLDLYLMDLICDCLVKAYQETFFILRRSNELKQCGQQWENACEAFSLRMYSRKLCLEVCGLFVVDKSLWFLMFTAICSYTLVLMQFHIAKNRETKTE